MADRIGPGGAGRYQDAVYDRNAPGRRDELARYWRGSRPDNEERLTTEAMVRALAATPEELRVLPPPLPQIQLFRPRFGYDRDEIGIMDVINVGRGSVDPFSVFAGTSGSYTGSATPSLGWW